MQGIIKKFYNTEEVAAMLGVSVQRLRVLALAGNIKAYRPEGARRWRFSKKSIAQYLGCAEEEL